MFLEKLFIVNFRNIIEQTIPFNKPVTVIVGKNAQGKTNLIEAVSFLSTLRSFRTSKLSSLKNTDSEHTFLRALVSTGNGFIDDLEIDWRNKIRVLKYLEKEVPPSEFVGRLMTVCFTPDDLQLIGGAPEERRRIIDRAIFHLFPVYLNTARDFNRLLKQRNRILQQGVADETLLSSFNIPLAKIASEVYLRRKNWLETLAPKCAALYSEIAESNEKIELRYSPSVISKNNEETSAEKIAEEYLGYWNEHLSSDLKMGFTLRGPHTDDLSFLLDGKSMKETASQGQRRSLIIAMKIAELEIVAEHRNDSPILLLDDVISELDETRRKKLVSYLASHSGQVIATTTDGERHFLDAFSEIALYSVSGGKITQRN